MARGLTERQLEALVLIARSIRDRGYAPTHRELVDALGANSVQYAHQLIGVLEQKGALERDPVRSRALRVTDAGWRLLADRVPRFRFVPPRQCLICSAVHFGPACPLCSRPVVSSGHAGSPGPSDP